MLEVDDSWLEDKGKIQLKIISCDIMEWQFSSLLKIDDVISYVLPVYNLWNGFIPFPVSLFLPESDKML